MFGVQGIQGYKRVDEESLCRVYEGFAVWGCQTEGDWGILGICRACNSYTGPLLALPYSCLGVSFWVWGLGLTQGFQA